MKCYDHELNQSLHVFFMGWKDREIEIGENDNQAELEEWRGGCSRVRIKKIRWYQSHREWLIKLKIKTKTKNNRFCGTKIFHNVGWGRYYWFRTTTTTASTTNIFLGISLLLHICCGFISISAHSMSRQRRRRRVKKKLLGIAKIVLFECVFAGGFIFYCFPVWVCVCDMVKQIYPATESEHKKSQSKN